MADSVLTVSHLTKHYPSFSLEDVSFQLEKGHIMGFIGRNGAGKTTTLKCIYGLVPFSEGEVLWFDEPLAKKEQTIKNEIGLLFGGIDYYPNAKAKVIHQVTRRFYPEWDESLYHSWIQYFELDENKRIKELSNGMKIKFGLSLALSHHAKALLLDEPTSGLDPVSRDEILDCFRRITDKEGMSILFSTHVISDLDKIADDITYIQKGKIIASQPLETFKEGYWKVEGDSDTLSEDLEKNIGHLRIRNGHFEGIIQAKDHDDFMTYSLSKPTLEEIMLYWERGNENEAAPL
jgi:ABC-2 type transport system ATP-binding protein